MGIKAVIFDLDGVIVFTDKFHYQAWKKMANTMGIYFDEKLITAFVVLAVWIVWKSF